MVGCLVRWLVGWLVGLWVGWVGLLQFAVGLAAFVGSVGMDWFVGGLVGLGCVWCWMVGWLGWAGAGSFVGRLG